MFARHAENRIKEALEDTRVVLIAGPRQAGKTTLAQQISGDDAPYLTLDDPLVLEAATQDPVGFIRNLDHAVIDEIQRAPELMLVIKQSVDKDPRPGRFLLTGSANLMSIPTVSDSLAGRMTTIRLLPLSQAEILSQTPSFIEKAFGGDFPRTTNLKLGSDLEEIVLSGGYPEALTRKNWARRQNWYLDYIDAIVQRDVKDVAQIDKLEVMPNLINVMAEHSGQLVNYSALGAPMGMNHNTTRKYTNLFDSLFLTTRLQPWFSNKLKRLNKTPKLHFTDAGLLAALREIQPENLSLDRTAFGPILESFVVSEVFKLASASSRRLNFYHFRDKQQNEVDLVIEDQGQQIVGLEIKASATVKSGDFAGLKKLQEATGAKFKSGFVLYDGDQTIPFGDKLAAVPISTLWA